MRISFVCDAPIHRMPFLIAEKVINLWMYDFEAKHNYAI